MGSSSAALAQSKAEATELAQLRRNNKRLRKSEEEGVADNVSVFSYKDHTTSIKRCLGGMYSCFSWVEWYVATKCRSGTLLMLVDEPLGQIIITTVMLAISSVVSYLSSGKR